MSAHPLVRVAHTDVQGTAEQTEALADVVPTAKGTFAGARDVVCSSIGGGNWLS